MKFRGNRLLLVGFLLVIASLAAEFLPRTSRGIGTLQIYVIAIGVLVIVIAFVPIAWKRILGTGFVQKLFIVLLSLVFGLVAIEGALAVLRYTPVYNAHPEPVYVPELSCTVEYGCQWDRDCPVDEDLCPGFRYIADRWYDFLKLNRITWFEESIATDGYKILVTGDSFTAGASADVGQSWVETMYTQLTEDTDTVFVWNTAIGGTATAQAAATARYFVNTTDVDLVLTGFYASNDYFENLFPVDFRVVIEDERGIAQNVSRYALDEDLTPVRLTDAQLFYRVRGLEYIPTGIEALLYRTRIGSVLGRRLLSTAAGFPEDYMDTAAERTRAYLIQLRAETIEQGVPLIVLLIPPRSELTQDTEQYEVAVTLFNELSIPYIDVLPLLVDDDYAEPPDTHWSNSGHGKAGNIMVECVQYLIENDVMVCPGA